MGLEGLKTCMQCVDETVLRRNRVRSWKPKKYISHVLTDCYSRNIDTVALSECANEDN